MSPEWDVFSSLLGNEDVVAALLQDDESVLEPVQRQRLALLTHKFVDAASGTLYEPAVRASLGTRPRKRARNAIIDGADVIEPSRNPWYRVLNLDTLVLPVDVLTHLLLHGTDPRPFFVDQSGLQLSGIGNNGELGNLTDRVWCCLKYTLALQKRTSLDRMRWIFQMLFFYDVVKSIRPEGSGRAGSLIHADIVNLFRSIREGAAIRDTSVAELDKPGFEALTRQSLNEWSCHGKKLNQIATEFGMGALFYLSDILSRDFLQTKYTRTGANHQRAAEHLNQLGLPKLLQGSKEDELAQNIRVYLSAQLSPSVAGGRR